MSLLQAKPIFIAKFHFDDDSRPINIAEELDHIRESLTKQLGDYHVLIVPIYHHEKILNKTIDFECFYPHDFPIKEFEEFKQNIAEQSKEFFKQSEN